MLEIGSLILDPTPGGAVVVEVLEDDWPTRFPFLEEPRSQPITGALSGELTYGQFTWQGFPAVDAAVEVEVTDAGNKVARLRWSQDGGATWEESAVVVPLGGDLALGDTGLTASFDATPAPLTGTTYEFTGPGAAAKTGTGPDVVITGSGSVDGLIEIQTGVGALQHRVAGGDWTEATMADLPIEVSPGVVLDISTDDFLGLELEAEARFDFTVKGYFGLRLTRGETTELYERMRVGDSLWFVSSEVPPERRSALVSSAAWDGSVRPPPGTYST